ncbi:hypothetical protein KP509_25G056700 [Ceratopteris richardii]|uniref:non-specific serine/threonine protein kinase n=1 Tax=Ceratopteris richardii TaxID=49495 RepID=A0A8T2RRE1_CERRI|nr:hypothetical protein KP509_25G056700 [Ceratopteris richardii]
MNNSLTLAPTYVVNTKNLNTSRHKTGVPTGAIVGSVAGAVLLVFVTLVLVCMLLLRAKKYTSRKSDTGSSDHSIQVVWAKRPESPLIIAHESSFPDVLTTRQFTLAELDLATKQWNETNLIGTGRFGLVYKGILEDGTIVAVKKREAIPSQEFSAEVGYLGHVRHRHLVILIGFCQENSQQMIVHDYIANGSVSSHLYDDDGLPLGELDFRKRLSIALGAARGLEHLHSLVPPLVHMGFKTNNVLVDENFVAKVTDFGISRLLTTDEQENVPSTRVYVTDVQGQELQEIQAINEKSDVFGFGVFLLELVSGREAVQMIRPEREQNLVKWLPEVYELSLQPYN